jgi:hypothetical protein
LVSLAWQRDSESQKHFSEVHSDIKGGQHALVRRRACLIVAAMCVMTLPLACTTGESVVGGGASTTSGATPTSNADHHAPDYAVDALGLTFQLPSSFGSVTDASFAFLARSYAPRAIFSIDHDSPNVVNHQPEGAESLTRSRISGCDAVTILNAVVKGLPPGIVANELGVANRSRSFSVIMSASERDLPALWNKFIRSVRIRGG